MSAIRELDKGIHYPPLSLILLRIVARMVKKTQREGLVTGLANNLIRGGVILLQYTDDTIVCLKNDITKARNMKLLLYFFELMSGLKINFSKSELILIHGIEFLNMQYLDLFNYGSFH